MTEDNPDNLPIVYTSDGQKSGKKDSDGKKDRNPYPRNTRSTGGMSEKAHQEMLKVLRKYFIEGMSVTMTAETTKHKNETVKHWFDIWRLQVLQDNGRDFMKNQEESKAIRMMGYDKELLEATVILSKYEDSLRMFDQYEDSEMEKAKERNVNRMRNDPHALWKRIQEVTALISLTKDKKTALEMTPTMNVEFNKYFEKQQKAVEDLKGELVGTEDKEEPKDKEEPEE